MVYSLGKFLMKFGEYSLLCLLQIQTAYKLNDKLGGLDTSQLAFPFREKLTVREVDIGNEF
jgi:hypothetical protein